MLPLAALLLVLHVPVAAAAAAAAAARRPCPAAWVTACPGEPCTPLKISYPAQEVMSFHADSPSMSWQYYNLSVITTIITYGTHVELACWAHKHGVRVVIFAFSDDNHAQLLTNETYQDEYVRNGVKEVVDQYPWVDGVQVDLEHFPRASLSICREFQQAVLDKHLVN